MKRKKASETIFTIKITEEQIALIRTFYMRVELLWTRNGLAKVIRNNGEVECIALYECLFCRRGSYENAASIPHAEDCIFLLVDREWDKLNTQFIEVLNESKEQP